MVNVQSNINAFDTANEAGALLVSVIVPAYNAADTLEQALNSALAQTVPNLEIIVVDDASSDATFEVACMVAARDPRVRVLQNEHNGGLPMSRNHAIDKARGEWLALLDADDAWATERLGHMLAVTDNADVVSDDIHTYVVRSSPSYVGKPKSWRLLSHQGLTVTEPRQLGILEFTQFDLGLLKPIIRRSFLQRHSLRFNVSLNHTVDFHLYFEMLATGARWLQLPSAYYFYYWHSGSMTRNTIALAQDVIKSSKALLNHPAVAADAALASAIKRRLQEWQANLAYHTVWSLLKQRRFASLARLLFEQPSYYSLCTKKIIRSSELRLAWGIRKLSERRLASINQ